MTLSEKTILLTRPTRQFEESRKIFEAEGAEVWGQPTTEILSNEEWGDFAGGDWIIFSSANGVDFFLETVLTSDQERKNREILASVSIAAVGPGTAKALEKWGLRADAVPENHCAEGLAALLADEAKAGKSFLSVRGDKGRKVLKEGLTALGGKVTEISVYRSVPVAQADEKILQMMEEGKIDYVTVTSPSIAEGVDRLFGDLLSKTHLVSISPLTSQKIRELGRDVTLEAEEASMEGILRVLGEFENSQKESVD